MILYHIRWSPLFRFAFRGASWFLLFLPLFDSYGPTIVELAWGCKHGEHLLLWRSIDSAILGLCLENFRFRLLVLLLHLVFSALRLLVSHKK